MKQVTFDEQRQVQLDILKDIHMFCKAEGIHYSLAFGTLLGAIRHKGFIPWDDDIDIMMMRKDYERFIKSYTHPVYEVVDSERLDGYALPYAKVCDTRTAIKEHIEYPVEHGVFVDIFPVDNVPDDIKERKALYKRKNILNNIHTLKIVSLSSSRSLMKNVVLAISHVLLFVVGMRRLVKSMEKLSTKYADQITKNAAVFAPSDSVEKWILPSSIYNDITEIEFENTEVCAIKEYHATLTALYGDYMQLPPVEQRINHHHFDAWWKEENN